MVWKGEKIELNFGFFGFLSLVFQMNLIVHLEVSNSGSIRWTELNGYCVRYVNCSTRESSELEWLNL